MRKFSGALIALVAAVLIGPVGLFAAGSATASERLDPYLGLPLTNRDASAGPGGLHPDLPTDPDMLGSLLAEARAEGLDPQDYQALLYQYWLVDATTTAGIDLASWDPRAGVSANRENLIKSYRMYEDLQLEHRELQWAGMAGQVGADFGGGLLDFEMATDIYDLAGLQPVANAIVSEVNRLLGPAFVDRLPPGLRALATFGAVVSADDLRHIQADILVMQKNIFTDLMPMHRAYVVGGDAALDEMQQAGIFDAEIRAAWSDIGSGDDDRIARGNARLLEREQREVIKDQWDATRAYKGDIGEAMTYATTLAGSPSVAGVVPPRSYKPMTMTAPGPDGRTATLTLPLPTWNWSVYDDRWDYISAELLPNYSYQVNHNWDELAAVMQTPYEQQMESHRPIWNIAPTLQSALETLKVTYQ